MHWNNGKSSKSLEHRLFNITSRLDVTVIIETWTVLKFLKSQSV